MPLEIRVSHRERYMSAKVSGSAVVEDFKQMLDALSEESLRMHATRLLLDMTKVQEHLKFMEHIVVSDNAVSRLGHLERVASLVAEGRKKGTSEQAARLRGMALRVFTLLDEAVDWLVA